MAVTYRGAAFSINIKMKNIHVLLEKCSHFHFTFVKKVL